MFFFLTTSMMFLIFIPMKDLVRITQVKNYIQKKYYDCVRDLLFLLQTTKIIAGFTHLI